MKQIKVFTLTTRVLVASTLLFPGTLQLRTKEISVSEIRADEILEQQIFAKYFKKDATGKLIFKMPAPILKVMNAQAAEASCSSSDDSSDDSSEGSDDSSEGSDDSDDSSGSDSTSELNACESKWSDYASPTLGFYHNALCRVNKGYTQNAQDVLCNFAQALDVDSSFDNLPIDVTDTFDLEFVSYTLRMKVDTPTEEFAVNAGYTLKAELYVNGEEQMVLYWDGLSAAGKGFLIESSGGLGNTQGAYVQWDLMDSSAQTVEVLAANMASGRFMGPLQSGYSSSGRNTDTAIYGLVNYSATDAQIALQYVELRAQRRIHGNSLGCYKVYAEGQARGELLIARSSNYQNGGSTTDQSKATSGLVGYRLADDVATEEADATSVSSTELSEIVHFNRSCYELRGLNGQNKPFAQNRVNFSAEPDDVF